MKFQFNEQSAIENMIKSKFVDANNITNTIYVLAKYNCHIRKLKDRANYNAIIEYITDNCPNMFEENILRDVDGCIKKAKKRTFATVDEVCVTKSELEFIKALDDIKQEKAAFVMLAAAKFFNVFKSTDYDSAFMTHSDICKLARITIPQNDRDVFMQFAYDKGVLHRHTWADSTVKKVAFVSHDDDDQIVMRLKESDYKDLAYTYLAYLTPVQFRRCQSCGRWIRKNNKSSRLCINCAKNEEEEKDTVKTVFCVDCGKPIYVNLFDTATCRCEVCRCSHLKEVKSEQNRRSYEKIKDKIQ